MSYIDQYKRVERFLYRIDPPSKDHGSQVEYEDNLWSFFQNAWHLKDWIKNDHEIIKIDIEKIVKTYHCLMICSDLANRTKHFENKNFNRVDAKFTNKHINLFINETPSGTESTSNYNYFIVDDSGREYNAIDLAKEILNAWSEIIDLHVAEIA